MWPDYSRTELGRSIKKIEKYTAKLPFAFRVKLNCARQSCRFALEGDRLGLEATVGQVVLRAPLNGPEPVVRGR